MMHDIFYRLFLLGALSSNPQMPFWATSGQYGLMPDTSGGLAYVQVGSNFDDSRTFQMKWGTSLAFRSDGVRSREFFPDELYLSMRWLNFDLDLGMKHRGMDYLAGGMSLGSLSSTGGNIVWSGNARTIPGVRISLRPTDVPFTAGHLQILGSWGDYITTDSRAVRDAWIHNMQAYLRFNAGPLRFTAGLDHNALWNGYSDRFGQMPKGLRNYLKMCVGDSGGSDATLNDQYNVLGNQLGAEQFKLEWIGNGWTLSLQHDIPYEDRSGMRFQNFPDGVNTIAFRLEDRKAWVSDVLYEYHYTMLQSGTMHDRPATPEEKAAQDPDCFHYGRIIIGGLDDYFNNGEYASGWTLHGRTIGDPLFYPRGTTDGSWSRDAIVLGVENNRIKAHHFAIGGSLAHHLPYKFMLTWSQAYGTYTTPYAGESQKGKEWGTVKETPLNQLSGAFRLEIPFARSRFLLLPSLYFDRGDVLGNRFAATIGICIR